MLQHFSVHHYQGNMVDKDLLKDDTKGSMSEGQGQTTSSISHQRQHPSDIEETLDTFVMDDFLHYDGAGVHFKDSYDELQDFTEGIGQGQTKNELEMQQEQFEKLSRLIEQNRSRWKKLEENMIPVDTNGWHNFRSQFTLIRFDCRRVRSSSDPLATS